MNALLTVACVGAVMIVFGLCEGSGDTGSPGWRSTLHLREHLGRSWDHEVVTADLPASPGLGTGLMPRARDNQGNEVLAQPTCPVLGPALITVPGWAAMLRAKEGVLPAPKQVKFLADLPAKGQRRYTVELAHAPQAPVQGVTIRREAGQLVVDAGAIAVRVPESGSGVAPLLALRGTDGRWRGRGELVEGMKVKRQTTQVLAEGPVFAVLWCHYDLAGAEQYDVLLRLVYGEPVVLITEDYTGAGQAGFELVFEGEEAPVHAAWDPDSVTVDRRHGTPYSKPGAPSSNEHLGYIYDVDYSRETTSWIQPYHSWEKNNTHWWAAWYESGEGWGVFALHPARWKPHGYQNRLRVISQPGKALRMSAALIPGERHWGMMVGRSEQMAGMNTGDPGLVARLQIKHGIFPLDEVKDWVLEWPEKAEHPRVLIRPRDVEKVREKVARWRKFRELFEAHRREIKDPAGEYLLTGDDSCAQAAAQSIVEGSSSVVARVLNRGLMHRSNVTLAMWGWMQFGERWDLVATSRAVAAEDRQTIRANLAFLTYVMSMEDVWPPAETGIMVGNVNFETAYQSCRGVLAATLADHPRSDEWLASVEKFFDKSLWQNTWPGGVWQESPNYQAAPVGIMMHAMAALAMAGRRNFFLDKCYQSSMDYLLRIQTPYDVRQGRSLLPTVGDTNVVGSQGLQVIFAWAAHYGREDAEFSRRMMFAWRRGGAPLFDIAHGWVLWYLPACAIDPALPAAADLDLQSQELPGYGALLRQDFNTDRETYLLFKCGAVRQHFDPDEGSFHLYALGMPLALDYGCQYQPSNIQPWFHNRLSFDRKVENDPSEVLDFVSFTAADYVRGEQRASATVPVPETPSDPALPRYWEDVSPMTPSVNQRRVVFVKGEPGYFVITDAPNSEYETEWSIHVLARRLELTESSGHFTGQHGVDLDVLVAQPSAPRLSRGEWQHTQGGHLRAGVPAWAAVSPADLKPFTERQLFMRIGLAPNVPVTTLLWPRRSEQVPPEWEAIAGGEGLRVRYEGGEDLVFCGARPVFWKQGEQVFTGEAGLIRQQGDKIYLTLLVGSQIGVPELDVEAAGPLSLLVEPGRIVGEAEGRMRRVVLRSKAVPWRQAKLTLDGAPARLVEMWRGPWGVDLPAGRHRFEIRW